VNLVAAEPAGWTYTPIIKFLGRDGKEGKGGNGRERGKR